MQTSAQPLAPPDAVPPSRAQPNKPSLLSVVQRSGGAVKSPVVSLLGANVQIQGEVCFSGDLRIDGIVCGQITSGDDPSGTLTIGDGGQIQGDIRVANLIVYGHIQGNVYVSGKLDIRERALITGDVHYSKLEVVSGGVIQGRLIPA